MSLWSMQRSGIPFTDLATGTKQMPTGSDALDLTKCIRYALNHPQENWVFPDHYQDLVKHLGGPERVTPEHQDRAALRRWGHCKAVPRYVAHGRSETGPELAASQTTQKRKRTTVAEDRNEDNIPGPEDVRMAKKPRVERKGYVQNEAQHDKEALFRDSQIDWWLNDSTVLSTRPSNLSLGFADATDKTNRSPLKQTVSEQTYGTFQPQLNPMDDGSINPRPVIEDSENPQMESTASDSQPSKQLPTIV
jgi:hypothetical protein